MQGRHRHDRLAGFRRPIAMHRAESIYVRWSFIYPVLSKRELESELDLPLILHGRGHLPEISVSELGVRVDKVRSIGEVQRLESEFEPEALGDMKLAER